MKRASRILVSALLLISLALIGCDDEQRPASCELECPWLTSCVEEACLAPGPIDPMLIDDHPSLAIAPDGTIYMAGYASLDADLAIGVWNPGEDAFDFQLVDNEGDVGRYASLSLTQDGRPAIAYYDGSRDRLKFAELGEDGLWRIEVVDGTSSVGREVDLFIDDEDTPHLAYRDATFEAVRYAFRDKDVWRVEVVDPGTDRLEVIPESEACPAEQRERVGRGLGFSSQVVVQGGTPFLAYYDADCGTLRLAARQGEGLWLLQVIDGWNPESYEGPTSDPTSRVGRFVSMGLSPLGERALAYFDGAGTALKLSAGETLEVVDAGIRLNEGEIVEKHVVGQIPAMAYDQGWVIAHFDATNHQLMLAEQGDQSWRSYPASEMRGGLDLDLAISPTRARVVAFVQHHDPAETPIQLVILNPPEGGE